MAEISRAEVKRAIGLAWQVPGLFRRQEADFLYRLARRKGNLVELGCWQGRTTALLVQAAKIWGARVTSVDAFTAMPKHLDRSSAALWAQNLSRIGLTPPELWELTTAAAAPRYTEEIALLFIDANHSEAGVRKDLAQWTPKVKVGGVVALHDMFQPSITGVAKAVVNWWSSERDQEQPRWELMGLRDYTIAFRRLSA